MSVLPSELSLVTLTFSFLNVVSSVVVKSVVDGTVVLMVVDMGVVVGGSVVGGSVTEKKITIVCYTRIFVTIGSHAVVTGLSNCRAVSTAAHSGQGRNASLPIESRHR